MSRQKLTFSKYQGARGETRLGFTVTTNEEDVTTINVQGVIGSEFDGLDAPSVVSRIAETSGPIHFRVNTPGGSVFDAIDIYHAAVDHPHQVTADIVGQAWSAGTIITASADEVRISGTGVFGIHRAQTGLLTFGNRDDLLKVRTEIDEMVVFLDEIDLSLAAMLSDASGNSLTDVQEMMVGEQGGGSQFVGQSAVDANFVDKVIPNRKKPKTASDVGSETVDNWDEIVNVVARQHRITYLAKHRSRQLHLLRIKAGLTKS